MTSAEYQARWRAKKRAQKEITTDFLEHELLKKYQDKDVPDEDKKDYLKFMIDIWKSKSKVPNPGKAEKEIDFGALINAQPSPAE